MIIQCNNCAKKFIVKDSNIPKDGRMVECGYCSTNWHQMPILIQTKTSKELKIEKPVANDEDGPSIDNIKASNGKIYRS